MDMQLRQYMFRDLELLHEKNIDNIDKAALDFNDMIRVKIHELNPY